MNTVNEKIDRWDTDQGREYKSKIVQNCNAYDDVYDLCPKYFGYVDSEKYGLIPDLAGISFSDCILDGLFLAYTNLEYSTFENCTLVNCQVHEAYLGDSSFLNVSFKDSVFISANLSRSKIIGCTVERTSFNGAVLIYSKIENSKVVSSDFIASNMTGVKAKDISLQGEVEFDAARIPLYLREVIVNQVKGIHLSRVLWTEEWLEC